jgi:CRISP-associated protein Cas1
MEEVVTTLYLTENRTLVRRDSEDCLLVQVPEQRDNEGEIIVHAYKKRIPLIKVDDVVVMGEVTLTASALHLLLDKKVEIHFLDAIGRFKGCLSPGISKNSLLRMAQHRCHQDIQKRCELARRFVVGKLSNQRTMLLRHQRRQESPYLKQSSEQIAVILGQLKQLDLTCTTAPLLTNGDGGIQSTPLETILGLEGAGSAAYFHSFGQMLSHQQEWQFAGRVRRPPTDPVNALLSYGYTLLTNQAASMVQVVGFDPYIGYLHSSTYGRLALALDIMEEFRPLIVDSVVLMVLNKQIITSADFEQELGAYRLKKEVRKTFITRLEERMNEEITHPLLGYKASYRRCIELQARFIAKYLTGELQEYQPLVTR